MRFFTLIVTFTLIIMAGHGALARTSISEQDRAEADEALNSLDSVPTVLRTQLLRSNTREQYISTVMNFLRRNGVDQMKLTAEGLKEKQAAAILNAKKQQRTNILRYDNNLDGQVTLEETKEAIIKQNPRYKDPQYSRQLENMMKIVKNQDSNEDGIVSFEEMIDLNEQQEKQAANRTTLKYQQYLDLDPNKDGMLTGNELEERARNAFNLVDKNKDGVFSNDEKMPYNKAQKVYGRQINTMPQCTLPKVAEDLKILSIGVYEGQALSNVTAVGQEKETTAIKINVKEGQPPTYLVLSSYDAIMWEFEGNIGAIKQIIIGSNTVNKNNNSGSGVIGIPKDRVTFAPQNCLHYYYDSKSAKFHMAKGTIKKLLGRFPDSITGIYKTGKVVITGGVAVFKNSGVDLNKKTITIDAGGGDDLIISANGQRVDPVTEWRKKKMGRNYRPAVPAPDGYDEQLWSTLLRYHPDGIFNIDASKVVSDEKAEPYEVLPQMAGIIKLIHEGKVEKVDHRQFRVIKYIPRFPAGLTGAHSVTLLIAPGVKKPEGSAGHACVIMEETGEAVSNKRLCR